MKTIFKQARFLFLASLVSLAFANPANADDTGEAPAMQIEKPWARASVGHGRPAAAYFTIRNNGTEADYLTSVSTPVTGHAEIHMMEMKDGIMSMRPAGEIEIPAGETVTLKPGGLHIMLMQLEQPLQEGGEFSLNATFKKAGTVHIDVPVLSPGAIGPE